MNIAKMMQQAKKMQENMATMQEELAAMEIDGEAGGGMVKVSMSGTRSVRSIKIDDSLWQEQDKGLIEDLVAAAINHASQKVEEIAKQKQQSMMAGMPLPPRLLSLIHDFGMPAPLARVVEMLGSLPGIGPKTALRLGLNILSRPAADSIALAESLACLHEQVGFCDTCGCFAEQGRCHFCNDLSREKHTVCLVEQPVDVLMMERGHGFRGLYHVLHGRMSPVDGVGPEQLNLAALDKRVAAGLKELILATSATVDGEATAHYLARRYEASELRISRIARGVPEGGELEYLDEHTLSRALNQRVSWDSSSI